LTQSAIGDFCRYAAKRPPIATGIAVNFVAEPMLASGLDQSQNMTTLSRCYTSYEPMSSRAGETADHGPATTAVAQLCG
jgi:hypothetical protein